MGTLDKLLRRLTIAAGLAASIASASCAPIIRQSTDADNPKPSAAVNADPLDIEPPGPYKIGPLTVYLFKDKKEVQKKCGDTPATPIPMSCYDSRSKTIFSEYLTTSLLSALREAYESEHHDTSQIIMAKHLTGDRIYKIGTANVLLVPGPEVEFFCGLYIEYDRKRQRIIGCYLNHNKTVIIPNDNPDSGPLATVHEFKHHSEGRWHR